MSSLNEATPCLIFSSIIINCAHCSLDDLLDKWKEHFGEFIRFDPLFNPALDYYSKEMGDKDELKRLIICSLEPFQRSDLISAKLWAHNLEQSSLVEKRRTQNIDMGILCLEHLILATGKPYTHRPYLGEGVYADLCYLFQKKSYRALPWTYPDYAHEEKINFFNQMRQKLLELQHVAVRGSMFIVQNPSKG